MAVLAPAMIPLSGPKADSIDGGAGIVKAGNVLAGTGTTAGNGNVLAGTVAEYANGNGYWNVAGTAA